MDNLQYPDNPGRLANQVQKDLLGSLDNQELMVSLAEPVSLEQTDNREHEDPMVNQDNPEHRANLVQTASKGNRE